MRHSASYLPSSAVLSDVWVLSSTRQSTTERDIIKTWKSMIDIQDRRPAEVRRIGVANFGIEELEMIINATGVIPDVNQVELHPCCNPQKLFEYCKDKGIQLVAYSPLGSIGSPLLNHQGLKNLAGKKWCINCSVLIKLGGCSRLARHSPFIFERKATSES
ncbi:hypothetical protein KL930_004390 [Ogataea haglerorum]|uniref:uncharacterized protein n=1 Tax=Ogataea haglerorum TaxID=1937702 RepID=UPI001C8935B9|nr:uncharacterized protein KL911_004123 [Ogataea haglerorum]KAG7746508.1 hypothetical protein KL912_004085 [Ogataea haglerorum]KAG7751877.1 hypothetical protein KL911_004123 [Ogataea haglerorum]KAG7773877.1 hypothetical protein KL930_004390 [Ogataea haglerorum]KAG7776627.1 hypothetical protein KL922_003703 [Ogataea haglerorum]